MTIRSSRLAGTARPGESGTRTPTMIFLFTDFGPGGPYVGQMHAVLGALAPAVPVVDLVADAPPFNVRAAAYLLASLVDLLPESSIVLGIVDPGVGSERAPIVLQADRRWYVGPDNGLFEQVVRRCSASVRTWTITWRPPRLSATFHGRDLFAPVAAMLACGETPPGEPRAWNADPAGAWPDDLPEVIYIDGYGNAVTGIRAAAVPGDATVLTVCGRELFRGRTFSEVPEHEPFWYENANGLIEIAVNKGRADQLLKIGVGTPAAIGES